MSDVVNGSSVSNHYLRPRKGLGNSTILITLGIIGAVLAVGMTPRLQRQFELDRVHHQLAAAVQEVNAMEVAEGEKRKTLTLPGDTQPIQNIPIYARVNGYLSKRFVDIGDNVKAGQLLALIATPELDQQVEQAVANLHMAQANLSSALSDRENFAAQLFAADATIKQARTNLEYSNTELKRYQELATEGAVSYEQRDQNLKQFNSDTASIQITENNRRALLAQVASSDAKIAAAKQSVKSNQANLDQLKDLQGFQKVVAQSDGVITDRFVDEGALVAAGGSTGTTQLLAMAKTDVLRIYVDVPQVDYRYIHDGDKAEILLQEYPKQVFVGTVTNIAGSLNSNSRTLQTEIRIQNQTHILKPGSYADVRFVYNNPDPPVLIPSTTAITKDDGLYVAVVVNGKVSYRRIEVSRDFGNTLEVSKGVVPHDVILLNPPDGLAEGAAVKALVSHSVPHM